MGHNIRVPRDCEYEQPCKWLAVNGAAVDITNITLTCNVKSYQTRATANLSPTVTKTTPLSGLFEVSFTKTQTASLVKEDYYWEVLAAEPGGAANTSRIISGRITMLDTGDSSIPIQLQTAVQDILT